MHVQLDARDRVEGKRRRRRLAHVVLRVVREGERKGSGQIGPNPSLSCWAMPGPEPLFCGCNRGGGGLPAAALASRRSSRRPTARRPSPPPPSRRRPTPRRPPRRGARGGAPRTRAQEARHQRREHLRPPEQAAAAAAAAEARCKGMQRACSDPGQRACHAKQRMWMWLGGGRGVSPPAAARGAAWPPCASRRSIRRSCRTRPNRARTARGGGGGGRWRRHNQKGEAGWLGEGQGESRREHATMAADWEEVEGDVKGGWEGGAISHLAVAVRDEGEAGLVVAAVVAKDGLLDRRALPVGSPRAQHPHLRIWAFAWACVQEGAGAWREHGSEACQRA